MPVHGVFVPNHHEVSDVIGAIARGHLGLDGARVELREALKVVERFEDRDPIESAQNQVQTGQRQTMYPVARSSSAKISPWHRLRPGLRRQGTLVYVSPSGK